MHAMLNAHEPNFKCTYHLVSDSETLLNQYSYFNDLPIANKWSLCSLLSCKLHRIAFCTMLLSLTTLIFLLYIYYFCMQMCNAGSCINYYGKDDFLRLIYSSISPNSRPLIGIHEPTVHIAVVACNQRLEEPLNMIKSAIILGEAPIHAHFFTEDDLTEKFREKLDDWFDAVNSLRQFSYSLYPIQFPRGNAEGWKKLFKPCACQRLFIPDILTHIDSALYLDTDILFLRPPEDVWAHFKNFNSTQLAALAPESEDKSANWYVRFARHPFYPPFGLNSGVMLMNLTRMRAFGWGAKMQPLYDKYKKNTTWGDQDIINILFHRHPELVYTYGCQWNYRPDHCMYMQNCRAAYDTGVFVLHGSRGWFHDPKKQPVFKAIYQTFLNYTFDSNLKKDLLDPLVKNMANFSDTRCGSVRDIFTKSLAKYV